MNKLKINDPMGLTKQPRKKGKYAKKPSKAKNWAILIGSLIAIAAIIYAYNAYIASPEVFTDTVKESITDVLSPEQRAQVLKQQALIEREAVLNTQKAQLDADYKAKNDALNKEFEEVRSQKLSFQ